MAICEISMTSLITSKPKRSPASRSSFKAFQTQSLEGIWRDARLECAATQARALRLWPSCSATVKSCSRDSTEQGPAITTTSLAADLQSVGKLDDGSLRAETASGQLVRRADAVNVLDAGQALRDCEYRNRCARPPPPARSAARRWCGARRSPSQPGVRSPAGSALRSRILALQQS